ncbi:MAG TPA: hypothetical protein VLD36_12875, partial [Burkholderiales bacterium]|nr:hypothetical protein [Burkholderiales bacterium]
CRDHASSCARSVQQHRYNAHEHVFDDEATFFNSLLEKQTFADLPFNASKYEQRDRAKGIPTWHRRQPVSDGIALLGGLNRAAISRFVSHLQAPYIQIRASRNPIGGDMQASQPAAPSLRTRRRGRTCGQSSILSSFPTE